MRTANNEEFKYSQLKSWLFLYYFAEKNKIERLQLRLLFLIIIYLKIISIKLLGLADLARAQTFCMHKTTKVAIIGKYKYFKLAIF